MFEYSRLKRRKYIKLSCTDHRIIFFRWRRGKQSRWNPNRKRSPKTRHLGKLRSLVRRPRRVERLVASGRTFEDMIPTFLPLFFHLLYFYFSTRRKPRSRNTRGSSDAVHPLGATRPRVHGRIRGRRPCSTQRAHSHGDREHAQTPFIPTASLHRNTNALRPRLFY